MHKTNKDFYRIFDAEGNPQNIKKIVKKIDKVDVVFLGENHDDSVAHSLQMEIFKDSFEKYKGDRTLALSLEMFCRDETNCC